MLRPGRGSYHPATMTRPFRVAALLLAPLLLGCFSPPGRAPEARLEPMRRTVYFLADDRLEGRGLDTRGIEVAADYLARELRRAGLAPIAGLDGYFQTFEVSKGSRLGPGSSLRVAGETLRPAADYALMAISAEGAFDAPVVFAGYGIAQDGYDDYAGIDVAGKVVLLMRYEPVDGDGNSRFTGSSSRSDAAGFLRKARRARDAGAAAVLMVDPRADAPPDTLAPMNPSGGGRAGIPVLQISRSAADRLLLAAGRDDLLAIQSRIDAAFAPESRDLGVSAAGAVAVERDRGPTRNVVALLPGRREPAEYIVLGAHYDHLGYGRLGGGLGGAVNEIHNGADDNASGTAALLEVARRLARGPALDRSVIVAFFSAEEIGLVGSEHFVDHPPVPLEQIAFMVNLDMVGRLRNDRLQIGGSGTAADFAAMLDALDAESPVEIAQVGRGGLGPSDHATFARKGIPVLFFFTGLHADYHRPGDDAPKINFAGMRDIATLAIRATERLDDLPRQAYVADFDRESFSGPSTGPSDSPRARATLGVIPDYGSDESDRGVPIDGVGRGSPAEAAGLRDGDVIVQAGDMEIRSLSDLTEFLARSEPGQVVAIVVLRGEQRLSLPATLGARGQ